MLGLNSNKRVAPRIAPRETQPIEVQIMGSNHLDILPAKDISVSGIGVQVPHRFQGCDLAQEVELIITLPGCRPFLAYGVIRHWHGAGDHFGVEFTHIDSRWIERIRSYIQDCIAEPVS